MLVRKAETRGKNNISWLNANHTFSFGQFYDPKWTHFNKLLVINEDTIAAAMGFGTHPHRDMEIITYVIEGEIKHRDSMGSLGSIGPGEIQVMSAGTGVAHSEFNGLTDAPTHLLQIWIEPDIMNQTPRYAQERVYVEGESNFLKVIASADGEGAIKLNAEAKIWAGRFDHKTEMTFKPTLFDQYWVQIVKGGLSINDQDFKAGDGIAFEGAEKITLTTSDSTTEFLVLEVGKK
jgi:redox-sensitive bicupin YhaK (pirin superfamily)